MQPHTARNTDDPFLRIQDVEAHVGLKKSTIYEYVKRGTFPAPIRLGERASGWLLSEIQQWQQHRIEASRGIKAAAK